MIDEVFRQQVQLRCRVMSRFVIVAPFVPSSFKCCLYRAGESRDSDLVWGD